MAVVDIVVTVEDAVLDVVNVVVVEAVFAAVVLEAVFAAAENLKN